jgi:hypothetical protein
MPMARAGAPRIAHQPGIIPAFDTPGMRAITATGKQAWLALINPKLLVAACRSRGRTRRRLLRECHALAVAKRVIHDSTSAPPKRRLRGVTANHDMISAECPPWTLLSATSVLRFRQKHHQAVQRIGHLDLT